MLPDVSLLFKAEIWSLRSKHLRIWEISSLSLSRNFLMRCTVRRLACPQQILQWFTLWNWLKCKPWSFSLSTFLSPTPLVLLLSVPNICSGKIPAKFPLWTVFSNIKSCCISQVILCHFKHTKCCYLPDITWRDATTHQVRNMIIVVIFSACPFILSDICEDPQKSIIKSLLLLGTAERACQGSKHKVSRSGNPNPQLWHCWGNPSVTLGLAHSPSTLNWKSGQLPLRPMAMAQLPKEPSRMQKHGAHIYKAASILLVMHQDFWEG